MKRLCPAIATSETRMIGCISLPLVSTVLCKVYCFPWKRNLPAALSWCLYPEHKAHKWPLGKESRQPLEEWLKTATREKGQLLGGVSWRTIGTGKNTEWRVALYDDHREGQWSGKKVWATCATKPRWVCLHDWSPMYENASSKPFPTPEWCSLQWQGHKEILERWAGSILG